MKHKQLTIQTTLSISFMIILIIVLFAFGVFYSVTESKRIQNQTFESLTQNVVTLSSSIDNNISQMDMVSANVLYSNLIRTRFSNYVKLSRDISVQKDPDILNEFSYVDNIKILGDLLTAIIGPQRPVDQINLYSLDHGVFGTGLETGSREESASRQLWYNDVIQQNGHKVLTFHKEDNRLARYSTDPNGKSFLSLTRIYFDTFNNPQGIVEVKKSFNKVALSSYLYSPVYGEEIYVYDSYGQLIFSLPNISEDTNNYLNNIKAFDHPSVYELEKDNNHKYIIGLTSSYSGFTTAIVVSHDQLFNSIYDNIKGFLYVLIIIIVFAFVLSFLTAHQITKPIHHIYEDILNMNFDSADFNLSSDTKTRIAEITTLYDALLNMQNKLEISISNQLLLKNKEMQSKMLALQSQMNPHFLFNSLSTIQSMSEEHMNDEIVMMCQTTSSILRYIASDKEQTVSIHSELHHTVEYLKCMQMRYENQLSYDIDIPKKMENIHIPKLCIQLLVENAIKFTALKKPPWKITISGHVTNQVFRLSVKDNGPGFTEQSLKRINEEIEKINLTELLPSLELKGMGLLNIYLRLKLIYPKEVFFEVSNSSDEGAIVTIGGNL